MRPALTLLAALTLVLAAADSCNGPSGGQSLGQVTRIWTATLSLNTTPIGEGSPLVAQDRLSTDADGTASFKLQKLQNCHLSTSTEVQVQPSSSVLLRYVDGDAWCSTQPSGANAVTLADDNLQIVVADPIFGVSVGPAGTVVQVAQGAVSVSRAGGPSRIVGPSQAVRIAVGGQPGTVERFDPSTLANFETLHLGDLLQSVAPPDFSRPDPGESPGLRRIVETGTLLMAVDESALQAAPPALGFAQALTSFWGESWQVKGAAEPMSGDLALRNLASGQIAGFITPSPPASQGFPLFADPSGQVWFLVAGTPSDQLWQAAAQTFVRTAIEAGTYTGWYQQAFEAIPSLDALGPVLGL